MSAPNTVVLVTGAARGLGKGFVERYLQRPNYTVIAANRDVESNASQSLLALPKGANSSLILVKLDASVQADAKAAVKELQSKHGITHIDVLIANAGISQAYSKVADVDVEHITQHMIPNTYGAIWIYQAARGLMEQAKEPKFASIGSSVASLNELALRPMPCAGYAPSKVVLHWITAKIHYEEPKIISLPLEPGWVQTDMGNGGAVALGYEKAEITIDQSVSGLIKVIDQAKKDTHSGKFWAWTGQQSEF